MDKKLGIMLSFCGIWLINYAKLHNNKTHISAMINELVTKETNETLFNILYYIATSKYLRIVILIKYM